MGYCVKCGIEMQRCIPVGDTREREQCPACRHVYYENPTLLIGCFLYYEGALLWTKRAMPPKQGFWSFPTGFVENSESLQEAAARELYEETLIQKQSADMLPMSLISISAIDQIYVGFRCPMEGRVEAAITEETTAAGWFEESEAPWDLMAYPEQEPQIREIYSWIRSGNFSIRIGDVRSDGDRFQNFELK